MSETQHDLTPEELDAESVEELPDREAMSLINANIAAPINAAVALNVASDGSIAYANAEQTGSITQSTGAGRRGASSPPADLDAREDVREVGLDRLFADA